MRKSIYLLTTTPSSHTHRFHPLPLATPTSCSPHQLATPIHSTHSPQLSSILLTCAKFKVWTTIVESGWNVWVWLVGVVSGCGEQEVGVATGCRCKEVYRSTYPYSSCICSFLQLHTYFLFIFLMFYIIAGYVCYYTCIFTTATAQISIQKRHTRNTTDDTDQYKYTSSITKHTGRSELIVSHSTLKAVYARALHDWYHVRVRTHHHAGRPACLPACLPPSLPPSLPRSLTAVQSQKETCARLGDFQQLRHKARETQRETHDGSSTRLAGSNAMMQRPNCNTALTTGFIAGHVQASF